MVAIVYMVAGMSSRFGGKPKQFEIVGPNNESLIEYSVKQALTQNFTSIIFITNPKTNDLHYNIFGDKYQNINVHYVCQTYDSEKRSRPWGTTDCICTLNKIYGILEDSFILVIGDNIYGIDTFKRGFVIMSNQNNHNSKLCVLGGVRIIDAMPKNKGFVNKGIVTVKDNYVTNIEEVFDISEDGNPELMNEIGSVNFIGLHKYVLPLLQEIVDKFKSHHVNDTKIECLLPNDISILINQNKLKMTWFEIEDNIIGITRPNDTIVVRKILENQII